MSGALLQAFPRYDDFNGDSELGRSDEGLVGSEKSEKGIAYLPGILNAPTTPPSPPLPVHLTLVDS